MSDKEQGHVLIDEQMGEELMAIQVIVKSFLMGEPIEPGMVCLLYRYDFNNIAPFPDVELAISDE